MARIKKIENILSEELKRFNQIGSYVKQLDEQFLGFAGGSFELSEQEEGEEEVETEGGETNVETDDLTLDDTDTTEDELSLDDTTEDDLSMDTDITTDVSGNTEEIDVTDIVKMTKETGEKTSDLESSVNNQKDSIDSLIDKLDDLENKLNYMDKLMTSIGDLEDKIEEFRPQTPEEKLELRYLDSGPFNQSPKKYWEEKKGELKKQKDKHDYVLTSDDVEDYNDSDIKNSWVYNADED